MVSYMYFSKKKIQYKANIILNNILPQTRLWDKIYSFVLFIVRHHRIPKNQLVFNDVLYKMKTSNDILDPLRVFVTDKEFVKIYIKAIVGDKYNVSTIDIIRSVDQLNTYVFPANCCIKSTHGCGNITYRINNDKVDINLIKNWFKFNCYKMDREANYKTLIPKVIIEPIIMQPDYINDYNSIAITNYKIFCYHGVPKLIQVDVYHSKCHQQRKFFDCNWRELNFSIKVPKSNEEIQKPSKLSEMLMVSSKLSAAFSFVRIDLYTDKNQVLVGEITHCAGNAGGIFIPRIAEYDVSKLIFNNE